MNLFFHKKHKSILLFFGLIYFSTTIQGQVEFQCCENDANGTLTIMIWNPNLGKRYKLEDAQKDALNILIWKGLSLGENCNAQFNLLSSNEELERFKVISSSFFSENGDWTKFVGNAQSQLRPSGKRIKEKWAVYTLKLSRLELKKYLQTREVIRNLNSGF